MTNGEWGMFASGWVFCWNCRESIQSRPFLYDLCGTCKQRCSGRLQTTAAIVDLGSELESGSE
jgi:hypothetical protein